MEIRAQEAPRAVDGFLDRLRVAGYRGLRDRARKSTLPRCAADRPRSLGCAGRAFQNHHSSTATRCRCRVLIRELIAVDRDKTLLIRIVPSGKATADNMQGY